MPKNRNYFIIATVIVFSTISLLQYGCRHDPEVYPDICFEWEILPVFQNNCTKSGCHNPEDAKSDVVLNNYENIMAAGVSPGDAKKSLIYKALTRGVEVMPPGGRLTGNQIALIYSWIQGGAMNTTGCGFVECDTIHVTYNSVIAPIFTANCIICHNGDSVVDFSNYTHLSNYLDSNAQKLLNNINYVSGYQSMPPSGQLDACTLKKIRVWINAGYQNN